MVIPEQNKRYNLNECLSIAEGEGRIHRLLQLLFALPFPAAVPSFPAQATHLADRLKPRPRGTGSGVPQASDFRAARRYRRAHAGIDTS